MARTKGELEFDSFANFPVNGSETVLYIATDTNVQYRWNGSSYVSLGSGGGGGGTVDSIVAGTNISVDNTDPANPIVSSLADRYKTTSTTSQTIVSAGSLTFTVGANLAYTALQDVSIVYDVSNHMHGTVTSYSGTTLVVDISHKTGAGTYASWTINLDAIETTPVTVTDSSTINLSITSQDITADVVPGSIGTTQLSAGVNTSLGKADTALQSSAIGTTIQGYSSVLAGTTASFTIADEAKLDGIQAGAEVNVNADWNAVSGDAQILNKPTIPTQYTDEQAQDAVGSILVDSSEIDFTYNDATPSITASLIAGSIDETKLDTSVNASLDLADTSLQPSAIGTTVQAYDADLTTWAGKTAPSGTVVGDTDTQTLTNKTVNDSTFTIQDDVDNTKKLQFQASGISTGTTVTLTAPNASGTIATLSGVAQTFQNTTTFAGTSVSVGTSINSSTLGVGTGATSSGNTKTINIGTNGASGSTTNITLGSATGGATTTITANGDITVPDEAYGVGWNGSLEVPTKNAIYDKIEAIPALTDGDKGDITVSVSGTVWTADADAIVKMTGDQTIAGTKTFSSDIIVPDEIYGVAWDGSLEVPTKNAIYDQVSPMVTNLASKADDTNVVHKTGNESILGLKNFTSNIQTTGIELGNASDTTIARVSAGVVSIEGVNISTVSSVDTLTNKNLTSGTNTFPTFNQDTTGKSASTDALKSATTTINVSSATAPTAGQVLTATSGTAATWQTPSGGGGSPGGSTGEIQYNNAGAFAGAANVEIDTGNLKLVSTTDPTAPTGGIIMYSKSVAGRHMPKVIGPSGIDTIMQEGLHGNSIFMVGPASGTAAPTTWGGTLTTATTMSMQQTIASANPWQATQRKRFTSSAVAASSTGMRTAYLQWFRGNAAGFGGFWFRTQFGSNTNVSGAQAFVGLCGSSAQLATSASSVSNLFNSIGVGFDTTDVPGNWFLVRNDGTGTATKVDLGANAARANTTHGYDLVIYCPPGAATDIYVRIVNLHTGVVVLDTSYNTDIPAVNTGLAFKCECNNGAAASSTSLEVAKVYISSDY